VKCQTLEEMMDEKFISDMFEEEEEDEEDDDGEKLTSSYISVSIAGIDAVRKHP
jgi:hypothetical protein